MMSMIMTFENKTDEIRIRHAEAGDAYGVYRVLLHSYEDMIERTGQGEAQTFTAEQLRAEYANDKYIHDFLENEAEYFEVAERAGEIVGYARTINAGGQRELTDFFVLPEVQASGVGKELLKRAFPPGAKYRSIIATTDISAQALYMKAGLYPYTNIYSFVKAPEARSYQTDLQIVPVTYSRSTLHQLAVIDAEILEIRRDAKHEFLLGQKTCFIYYRNNRPVGYGYTGKMAGPFALLNSSDYPAILAHAETYATSQAYEKFNVNIPTTNSTVVRYAMENGFRLDDFSCVLMLEKPFGRFENYAVSVPMYFL